MSNPLALFGVSDADVQAFVVKYAQAWAQVPARLLRVQQIATEGEGAGRAPILAQVQALQNQYATTSNGVAVLLGQAQPGGSVDLGLAAQTIPAALGVLSGTDQLESAVGLTPGTAVSVTANVPWYLWLGGLVGLYFLFKRRKGGGSRATW